MSSAHSMIGLFLVLGLGLWMAFYVRGRQPWKLLGGLAFACVGLRVLGGLLRHFVIVDYYRGFGDAIRYHVEGLRYADALLAFDMGRFFDLPPGAQWWGTQMLEWLSGVALAIIGPTLRGEFVLFSLVGCLGSLLLMQAYAAAAAPDQKTVVREYLWVMCLWPSMWFWPSSIGKEAVVLCAVGLAVVGYVGRREAIRWLLFLAGIALTFAIRPHVAAVLLASVFVAEWFGGGRRWTLGRTAQALLALAVFVYMLRQATAQFGFGATDLEGASEFFQFRSGQTQAGGSQIGAVGGGVSAVLMAYINILFRPLVIEAHNVMALASAIEVTVWWVFAFRRRRRIIYGLRNWKKSRFLRLGVPFTLLYVLMIGLTFSNLGIIARQRVLVLPFLFAILVGRRPVRAARRPSPGVSVGA